MKEFLDFAESHPVLFSALVWPLITAIVTALFKPRTPEEYAALPPRLAAFLRLIAALGLDPVKAVKIVQEAATKEKPKTDLRAIDGGKDES